MLASHGRKWLALALLASVQFMVVLDIAIVNVALPSIQTDLGFSQENLQWVISAYALLFGGFLLLGGRAADLFGRRRLFLAGIVLFTVASLLAGFAWSEASLIAARALQGLGRGRHHAGRSLDPHDHLPRGQGPEHRSRRLGRSRRLRRGRGRAARRSPDGRSSAGSGSSSSTCRSASRPSRSLLCCSARAGTRRRGASTCPGATLVTSGLVVLVYAITQANDYGWTSVETIGLFAASAALLAGFIGWEARVSQPLMPFSIFRLRTLVGANLAGLSLGTALFAMFLMLTLYMQQVLGYSAMKTGVGYLAVAGTAIVWSAVAAQLVTRVGVKPVLVSGMSLLTVGLLYFTRVDVGGSYLGDLLPGFLLISIGMGFSFVPISIAALAGVRDE